MSEWFSQTGKVLIEIIKHLTHHPVFLFCLAGMLISTSGIIFLSTMKDVPTVLQWFPYILLLFCLVISIVYLLGPWSRVKHLRHLSGLEGWLSDGDESFIEPKMIENNGEKVSATFEKVESQTQLEIKRLQITQELSMLQMQLSNLRAEKRNLERDRSRNTKSHLKQIQDEESLLLSRIETLQNALSSPKSSELYEKIGYLTSYGVSNCSHSTTLLLAIFTGFLGGHRYYTGRIGSAIIQTFTVGGFYIWWIMDIISIVSGNFKDSKGRPLDKGKKANPVFVIIILCLVLWGVIKYATTPTDPPPNFPTELPAISTITDEPTSTVRPTSTLIRATATAQPISTNSPSPTVQFSATIQPTSTIQPTATVAPVAGDFQVHYTDVGQGDDELIITTDAWQLFLHPNRILLLEFYLRPPHRF